MGMVERGGRFGWREGVEEEEMDRSGEEEKKEGGDVLDRGKTITS